MMGLKDGRYRVSRAPGGGLWAGLIVLVAAAAVGWVGLRQAQADPAKWESTIQKFERMDREHPVKPGGILFIGSSSIVKWDTDRFFPGMGVINRGFGGSELEDSIAFADRIVLPYKPRIVVLYAGDNDIAGGKTAQRVYDDFVRFAGLIHARLPRTRIIWLPIKPSIKRWEMADKMALANAMVKSAVDRDPRMYYLDVFTPMLGEDGRPRPELFVDDHLHMSEAGYVMWTARLKPVIEQADKAYREAEKD